jgi:hypothetical protein
VSISVVTVAAPRFGLGGPNCLRRCLWEATPALMIRHLVASELGNRSVIIEPLVLARGVDPRGVAEGGLITAAEQTVDHFDALHQAVILI